MTVYAIVSRMDAGLLSVCLPSAFPLDSLGFGIYAFPAGRRWESMSFLDPLEGTETRRIKTTNVRKRVRSTAEMPTPVQENERSRRDERSGRQGRTFSPAHCLQIYLPVFPVQHSNGLPQHQQEQNDHACADPKRRCMACVGIEYPTC